MLSLKSYQQTALDVLREYFQVVNQTRNPNLAFYQVTSAHDPNERGSIYNPIPQLRELPYVCLRIPTGGGKTLMACHAVVIAAQEYLRQERALVLWLVPTNTIKEQTLAALRNRNHPYRQALDATLEARVTVMDLAEALTVQRATLDSTTTIIVSTVAALRVEDTDGRKVYEQNGALMSHFENLSDAILAQLEKYENSATPIPSLANVFKMRRPVVIVDEAHNVRTDLSFDTLARVNPACILEFTATPTQPPAPNASNVLYHVSAYELKAAEMIKMPIHLQTHTDWREALGAAITKRADLETRANAERETSGEYIRPIVLLQAQPRNRELTVDAVKQGLLDAEIQAEQIAMETGEISEVSAWETANKKTIFDEACPIRFIITVQKLREGWDCPFAYVLCSVAEMSARGAVEQILGRVLRMPKAKRKSDEALNFAYAFVTSQHFNEAANTLADALVSNGFTRFEAQTEIETPLPLSGFEGLPFGAVVEQTRPPAERGEKFIVPQLALWVDGELEVVEESHFLDTTWNLAECDARLTNDEYSAPSSNVEAIDIDINARGDATLKRSQDIFVAQLQQQLRLLAPREPITAADLAVWLDRHIPHPDIMQTQAQLFLVQLVEYLMKERGFTIEQLSLDRLRLRNAAQKKIQEHRGKVIATAYQKQLFGDGAKEIEVSPELAFTFDPNAYAPNQFFTNTHLFRNHYYRAIGAMNDEEVRCAEMIDRNPNVKYWVRNVERAPNSFWLQTSTDKFYPDFVALLNDGRAWAIEYKGAHLLGNPDTVEKERIGELWAARSNGRCLFNLVGAQDYAARLRDVA